MGYELLVAFFCTVLLPLVVLGFVVFWTMNHRERAEVEDTWESYAAGRAREYLPARGEWPNRTLPAVRWKAGDLRFELSTVGAEAGARTRLAVWPRGRLVGGFVVRPAPGGAVDVSESKPAGIADAVLDASARRALLGFWQHDAVVLRYGRGRLALEWPGREQNAARIDEAVVVVTALAHAVDAAFLARAHAEAAGDVGVVVAGTS
jgi:hypothetical protein